MKISEILGFLKADNGIKQREGFTPKRITVEGRGVYIKTAKRDFQLLIEQLEGEKVNYSIEEVYETMKK